MQFTCRGNGGDDINHRDGDPLSNNLLKAREIGEIPILYVGVYVGIMRRCSPISANYLDRKCAARYRLTCMSPGYRGIAGEPMWGRWNLQRSDVEDGDANRCNATP